MRVYTIRHHTTTYRGRSLACFQSYMKEHGMRMGQLFELMVAWAKTAAEENFMPPTTQGKRGQSSLAFVFFSA